MTDRIKEMRVRYRTYTSHGWRWYLLDRLEAAEARAEAAEKRWQALRERLAVFHDTGVEALEEMDRLEAEEGADE